MELVLDRFGRVLLPKSLRRDYNLRPGSRLYVDEESRAIVLRPETEEEPLHRENGVLVFSGDACGDLDGVLERSRRERMDKTGGRPA